MTGHISGAHMNPSVSLTLALFRSSSFPLRKLLPYIVSQLAGATAASAVIYGVNADLLRKFEKEKGIVRGTSGSERSAMFFNMYFPNPALFGTGPEAEAMMSPLLATALEALATSFIVLQVFALSDSNSVAKEVGPIAIGFIIMFLVPFFAPFTMSGFNPARDFGPRLVAYMAGWGRIAIPAPRLGFLVYIIGPCIGGVLGGSIYELFLKKRTTLPLDDKTVHGHDDQSSQTPPSNNSSPPPRRRRHQEREHLLKAPTSDSLHPFVDPWEGLHSNFNNSNSNSSSLPMQTLTLDVSTLQEEEGKIAAIAIDPNKGSIKKPPAPEFSWQYH
eukprot:CAMPEP_0184660704 /NCGR_PEP_ID=MMETSP0308-20130426/34811_1 /TAXON_ID=38269 /ORGANISM="Gloeochaete witrockiana, Strain SAG 46.84" /LENGTH=329 /DNA_ID=CAMNT_0027101465 /DNA_START=181 /DNA_END=1170 /DNA_ORIENTATION=+